MDYRDREKPEFTMVDYITTIVITTAIGLIICWGMSQ